MSLTPEQLSLAVAMIIKPFAALALMAFLLFIRFSIIKHMPESKFKRLLLIRLNKPRR